MMTSNTNESADWFSSPNFALHPAMRLPSSWSTGSEMPRK